MKTVAVIPTRNEKFVGAFIEEVYGYVDDVVIADESDDNSTISSAIFHGAEFVKCEGGIGPSCVKGWKKALKLGADRVVQIDAGNSHSVQDIPLVAQPLADVVVGSRFRVGSSYQGRQWRALCSQGYARIQNGPDRKQTDWTSGFRSFSAEAAEYLADCLYFAKMHGWQAEVLHRAHDAGFDIAEVPIRYTAGRSSLRLAHVREALAVR